VAGRPESIALAPSERAPPPPRRLDAVIAAARFYGVDLDPAAFVQAPSGATPTAAMLAEWARDGGLWARAVRLRWPHLFKQSEIGPIVLLLTDGGAALLVGASERDGAVFLRDPAAPDGTPPVAVDELRLAQLWAGEVLLLRRQRRTTEADAPFGLAWLRQLLLRERRLMQDAVVASAALSFLAMIPPLFVMAVLDKVIVHKSFSTLTVISVAFALTVLSETALSHARRQIILVVSTRMDTRLNLFIMDRLLRLPLDYFERNPVGATAHRLGQVGRVREFLTGRILAVILDGFVLAFLLPLLFYLQPLLASLVLGASLLVALIITAFMRPLGRLTGQLIAAESRKSSVLVETLHGVRTVKAMALEHARRAEWDARNAEVGELRLKAGRLASWPQLLVVPIERFTAQGVLLVGAYLALVSEGAVAMGTLVAFMMLGQRVTQPLVSMARLLDDVQEVRSAVHEIATVLNGPIETQAGVAGARPTLTGEIQFNEVHFQYPGTQRPALEGVSFTVAAGAMIGLVGRSGSGKSTVTRLVQGFSHDYAGLIKIDGVEARELDLRYLRRNFGVVLQDNFLFRGSVRDNITAGRPGLTTEDVIRAARLAGAEEFIERLPKGYDTWIEEGSANLSGGQRQRLAIARALISNPRVLILDEATSALDPESEAIVNANLLRMGRGRTMLIVSHRLSSLVDCDAILVLDQGRVADFGPHADLLERCTIYRQLWLQQNRHTERSVPRHVQLAPAVPRVG
jgi:ATP-binding cassette, subfamily B, bacterial HlyB/CyaB